MQLIAKYKPLAASLMLLATTQAHATLTSYTANGKEVVYSSVSNVTWTKDANLLGSMMANQGFNTVVNAIIAASPTIANTPNSYSPSGTYVISISDFSDSSFFDGIGGATWFGAMAYINYLNTISYGGSNQWRLSNVTDTGTPGCNDSYNGTDCGYNAATNGTIAGDEYAELYYAELSSKARYDTAGAYQVGEGIIDPHGFFEEKRDRFWSGSEHGEYAHEAWIFDTGNGDQYFVDKNWMRKVWAISPGQITAVPEPESVMMLLLGLGLVGGLVRRQKSHEINKEKESLAVF